MMARLLALAVVLATFVALAAPTPTPLVATTALPPGAFDPDDGPSDVVYPAQSMPLRFDHRKHVGDLGMRCASCHAGALTSANATDRLLPAPATCDACHGSNHADLAAVTTAKDACATCHEGYDPARGNVVARVVMPAPNLVFSHQKHASRRIGCAQCHGAVEQIGLATRDQLPRMRGCFSCHQKADAASRGDAKSACDTCHVKDGPRLRTMFPSGVLKPPAWLHDAEHGPDFLERHKHAAGADSSFCSSCHSEDSCAECHDGRVRPRSVHPADYLNLHPIESRMATQRCASCHREQSFCLPCHQRVGVSESGPSGVRSASRFHPPQATWSDPPRRPGHHAFEAERNLAACVSCHVERDCVVCHGARGVGAGFSPHSAGFLASCAAQMRRNARPCFVCHDPRDAELGRCR